MGTGEAGHFTIAMSTDLKLLPEAKNDIKQAYQWYEEQSLGLGMDFIRCLEAVLFLIQRTPNIYPTIHESYHRAIMRRFPYAVFFEVDTENNSCVVYSVFHCSQDPNKWKERLL